jgi:hypothetical protein
LLHFSTRPYCAHWFSRFIAGWDLADTLETAPVLETVKAANKK